MPKLPKLLLTLLVALGLTIAVLTSASASRPKNKVEQQSQAAQTPRRYESSFVSVTPCRIADTRHGGGTIIDRGVRTFKIRGTGNLTAQGGPSGGCGIPRAATAITANVTVTGQTGNGYLIGYAADTAAPFTNFVSYRSGATITVNPTLPLAAIGTEASLAIKNNGEPVQVIIDVTGYYTPPIEGSVAADASALTVSPRVLSIAHPLAGLYTIRVDQEVSDCAVTFAGFYGNVVVGGYTSSDLLLVRIRTADGNNDYVDAPFSFSVAC